MVDQLKCTATIESQREKNPFRRDGSAPLPIAYTTYGRTPSGSYSITSFRYMDDVADTCAKRRELPGGSTPRIE